LLIIFPVLLPGPAVAVDVATLLCFTKTYTTAGLVLTDPWLSITLKLKVSTVLSVGTTGAVNVGVAVFGPVNITGIPVANCVH
jgi:hypothetical protein